MEEREGEGRSRGRGERSGSNSTSSSGTVFVMGAKWGTGLFTSLSLYLKQDTKATRCRKQWGRVKGGRKKCKSSLKKPTAFIGIILSVLGWGGLG